MPIPSPASHHIYMSSYYITGDKIISSTDWLVQKCDPTTPVHPVRQSLKPIWFLAVGQRNMCLNKAFSSFSVFLQKPHCLPIICQWSLRRCSSTCDPDRRAFENSLVLVHLKQRYFDSEISDPSWRRTTLAFNTSPSGGKEVRSCV